MSFEDLRRWHIPRIRLLVESSVDMIAVETIPSKVEAMAVVSALNEHFPNMPAYVSFTCKDDNHTCSGEPIFDAVCAVAGHHQNVIAVGVNCCDPKNVPSLIQKAKEALKIVKSDALLVAYPNSGEEWSHETGWHGLKTTANANHCLEWHKQGARLIGGCCRVGPMQIGAFHRTLRSKGLIYE
mmetsp:Transcript_21671/g.42111  ORF Transcript_21671/g.42111 Transcript_21671/m.42111 type:complete len:183 (-) Transcript_21671:50-598(-)